MSNIADKIDIRLGARIGREREIRGWSLSDLAERSGVSRSMINKIEHAQSSPTASLLGRLSGAFGLTLSTLLARSEGLAGGRVYRAQDQTLWRDPETGYLRRQICPAPGSNLPLEIVQVVLPAGASVSFPSTAYTFIRQIIWVLAGRLAFAEGDVAHDLGPGDCLESGAPADCTFRNAARESCTYVVAVLPS
jgi:transcriptional regulator with XRE-family HTH domain